MMLNLLAMFASLAWGAPQEKGVVMTSASTTNFLELCGRQKEDLMFDACNAFIWGTADGLAIADVICPPEDNWTLIAPRTVKKYIAEHPEEAIGYQPSRLVYLALVERYGCGEGAEKS